MTDAGERGRGKRQEQQQGVQPAAVLELRRPLPDDDRRVRIKIDCAIDGFEGRRSSL
jgi:hypothetical protein